MFGSCGKVTRIIQSQSIRQRALECVRGCGLDKSDIGASISVSFVKELHCSPYLTSTHEWRLKQGLPSNPNAYGPLTDGPDYSFIDGRPTPAGSGKVKRALVQRDIAQKIIELSKEVDFAVDLHQQKLKKAEKDKADILKRKLKPKGTEPS